MSIAVVGASGMLGRRIVARLRSAGKSPLCLDLPEFDLSDPEAVAGHPGLQSAETIFNCAAWTDVEGAEKNEAAATRINGDGVAHLAALAARSGALLLHVSTDFVFDGSATAPIPPDAPRSPLSAYGRSKLAGELALERSACRWLLVRTAWLYASGGKNFVETMLRLAARDGTLSVVCDQTGSPTSADDLAEACLALAARHRSEPARKTFHTVNAGAASWHQFACEIVRLAGLNVPVLPLTTAEAAARFGFRAPRPRMSVLDTSSLAAVLGRPMRPWTEALAACLAERGNAPA